MRLASLAHATIAATLMMGGAHAAGCASAPPLAASRGTAVGADASTDDPPIASASPSSSSIPAWLASPLSPLPPASPLPPLPAPSSSPTAPTAPPPPPEPPHVAYRGTDPFEAPPAGPIALAPTPPRPPGTDPSAEDLAGYPPYCAKAKECGVCNNYGRCGFCMATKTCVPKDANGAYPGSCSAGFTPSSCHPSLYIAKEEPRIHELLGERMRGLTPEGTPIDTKVDGGARVVRIPVRRGYCYGLVFRTSYDVDDPYALNAVATPEASFLEDGGEWMFVYTGAAALRPFCPQQSGTIVVGIAPDKTKTTKGTWRVQLFRKAIADEELRDRVEKRDTERRQRALRYVCGHCTRVFLVCRLDGDAQCTAQYAACLQSAGVRPDDCERGDVPRPPKPTPQPRFDACNPSPLAARGG